ncbi:hypothetical protein C9446_17985 [Providencia heimbachae]|uniref:hypothetical protein n=1 Tax=Providencia heimbachae TaxID=333962 RepID=UPI0010BF1900|nr:hypothetical protein [Providencia heimbachae]QCJ71560.1 hypothetical protein C9446_17985 [Providencia heimbachae]
MKKLICALLLGLSTFSVYAEEAPIQLSAGPSTAGRSYSKIYVTSRVDSVVIKKINVNRGNCKDAEDRPWKPVRLSFGSTYERIFTGKRGGTPCNVIEVVVDTSQGVWTFNFK